MNKALKILIVVLCAVLLVTGTVAGTLAWLSVQTAPITNTFTIGQIGLTLDETTRSSYKIVPGVDIPKDPTVTVAAGSETCWVFVKVEETGWDDDILQYAMADGWKQVPDQSDVYYRMVATSDDEQVFHVLEGDKLYVPNTVTESDLLNFAPTMTFTAYAIQAAGFEDKVVDAWNEFIP